MNAPTETTETEETEDVSIWFNDGPTIVTAKASNTTEYGVMVSAVAPPAFSGEWRVMCTIGRKGNLSNCVSRHPTRAEAEARAEKLAGEVLDVLVKSKRLAKYRL